MKKARVSMTKAMTCTETTVTMTGAEVAPRIPEKEGRARRAMGITRARKLANMAKNTAKKGTIMRRKQV
ncbi:hypothetical protein CLOM_g22381 [Closterium sp. NIES-68]|nr:hypothetical protein CLOM_g22381 [Closterium sp. NIES-68]GJP77820.1 hypothetical protein CLOP_g8159 [Closterium sp. NIES-67]